MEPLGIVWLEAGPVCLEEAASAADLIEHVGDAMPLSEVGVAAGGCGYHSEHGGPLGVPWVVFIVLIILSNIRSI